LLSLDLILDGLGHWVGILGVEHASEVKFGSDEHSSILVLDSILSVLINGRVSSFHLLVMSNSELVESSLSLGFFNGFNNHETNVNKGDDDKEDDVGVTHKELHGVDSDEISVNHKMIDKDHNHGLVEELNSNSLPVNVWFSGSVPEEVDGVHNQEDLKLEEWVSIEDRWDHHEEDSSKHRDWHVVLGAWASVHVNVKVHVVVLVSEFLGLEFVSVGVKDLGE